MTTTLLLFVQPPFQADRPTVPPLLPFRMTVLPLQADLRADRPAVQPFSFMPTILQLFSFRPSRLSPTPLHDLEAHRPTVVQLLLFQHRPLCPPLCCSTCTILYTQHSSLRMKELVA